MSTIAPKSPQRRIKLKLIARLATILALLTGLLYGRVLILQLLPSLSNGVTIRLGFLLVALLGLLAAWRWPFYGGLFGVIGGLGLGMFSYGAADSLPLFTAVFYSSPFIICGTLMLLSFFTDAPPD